MLRAATVAHLVGYLFCGLTKAFSIPVTLPLPTWRKDTGFGSKWILSGAAACNPRFGYFQLDLTAGLSASLFELVLHLYELRAVGWERPQTRGYQPPILEKIGY
jgi:hypothetical protein